MKQVAGFLRLELAQYRELAAFAQFGSELDPATQRQLARGERLTELLKQPQFQPVAVEKQIAIIFAGTEGYLDDLPVSECGPFKYALFEYIDKYNPPAIRALREKMEITEDIRRQLHEMLKEFKEKFVAERNLR
jgi:F-type H+-transporting ATPase subunit alpha